MKTIFKISKDCVEINGQEIDTISKCVIELQPTEKPKITLEFDATEVSIECPQFSF